MGGGISQRWASSDHHPVQYDQGGDDRITKIANGLPNTSTQNGFINVPNTSGMGTESLIDEVIVALLAQNDPGMREPTDAWNVDDSNDRSWS